MYDPMHRPASSNADEWALFVSEHLDSPGFLAVQIAEAIDGAVKRTLDATVTAVVYTIGGTVEGHPTSSINYLQRLRELVAIETAQTKG
jgi:hypothetical protein